MGSPRVDESYPKQFIDQATVQDVLHISRSTVHRWIKNGTLTAYRVGPRLLRFDPDEVEAIVRAAQVSGEQ